MEQALFATASAAAVLWLWRARTSRPGIATSTSRTTL